MTALGGASLATWASVRPAAAAWQDANPLHNTKLDLAIIRAAMSVHPGLYRYQSSREADRNLAQFERRYLASADREDMRGVFLDLSGYLTTLRCGHSYANFFNQDDADVKSLFGQQTRLPFWLRWFGSRMIVTHDTQGHGLVPGSVIECLNGQSPADLLTALLPYTRADGSNDGKRRALLGVHGQEEYETFDIFQGLIAPPASGGLHRLTLRTPDGRRMTRELPAIDLAQRRAEMTRPPETGDEPRWTWTERADGVRVLTMPGWAMWNSTWDWRGWLDDRLDSLDGARGLIIDIRDNEGGDDCGDPIIARLINQPLKGWPFETRLRFDEMPALLREHSSTWDKSFYELGTGARPLGNGEYAPREDVMRSAITTSPRRITCPVAALISPTNSSATFGFITAARASGKVRLFGETTGGNRRSINGGAFLFVKLPYSGIVFDLPLKGYVSLTPQPDRGIDPDVRIAFDPAWIGAASDPVIEAAAQWCKG